MPFDHILQLYPSPFKYESRMLREIDALLDSGEVRHVTVCALWEKGLAEKEIPRPDVTVLRIRLFTQRLPRVGAFKMVRFLEWYLRLLVRFLFSNINGVQYDVLRDNSGNITLLSYKRNANKINRLKKESGELSRKIYKKRLDQKNTKSKNFNNNPTKRRR